jgi:hypothetical protein
MMGINLLIEGQKPKATSVGQTGSLVSLPELVLECLMAGRVKSKSEDDMTELDLIALWEAHCRYEFETREELKCKGREIRC